MPTRVIFKVLSPAMSAPQGPVGPIPDPLPIYQSMVATDAIRPPAIGAAIVSGGCKVGNKWMGCTYTTGQYIIPGLGEVEFQKT